MQDRQLKIRPITDQLLSRFTAQDKVRGERIVREGRVSELRKATDFVWAEVLGDHRRFYTVVFYPKEAEVECSCPRHASRGACKHAWALLVLCENELAALQGRRWERALDQFTRLEERRNATAPYRITYGIHTDSKIAEGLDFRVHAQRQKADGQLGKRFLLKPSDRELLAPEDQAIVALLEGARRVGWRDKARAYVYPHNPNRSLHLDLSEVVLSGLVESLVATGRLHFFQRDVPEEPALGIADETNWRPLLKLSSGDLRTISLSFRSAQKTIAGSEVELFVLPGWFLAKNLFHRLAPGIDYRWLEDVDPRDVIVPAHSTDLFYEKVLTTSLGPFLELDEDWKVVELTPEEIRPVLQLEVADRRGHDLKLAFDYAGKRTTQSGSVLGDGENRRVIKRQAEVEQRFLVRANEVLGVDLVPARPVTLPMEKLFGPIDTLAREGFAVEVAGAVLRRAQSAYSKVRSGTDWFDLEGGIDFGSERVSYPEILAGLKRGHGFIELSDGSHGILPAEWNRRLALLDAAEVEGDSLRFQRNQGLLLDLLLDAAERPSLDAAFKKMSQGLKGLQGVAEKKEPRAFKGELRPYQRRGLGWLGFLREIGFGGCLADDMGLGKTVQVLAFLQQLKSRKGKGLPFLVVAPKSVTSNWLSEAERFTPGIPLIDYSGNDRGGRLQELPPSALVVTTYGLMRRDIEALREVEFDTVILDESQAIKNASAQTAKAARLLRTENRLALTGTPIENRIEELWSLFEFLNPGMFPSMRILHELGDGDTEDRKRLGRLISPFLLRRKKEQVAVDLPPRIEQTIICELKGKQRRYYEDVLRFQRLSVSRKMKDDGLENSKLHVLEALLRLRQIACHPGLVNDDFLGTNSSKIEILLEQLQEVIAEGHKALVFSQFTGLLAIVKQALDQQGITYEYLDGRTRMRAARIERFQTDETCPVFLISLKAGGTGLNLTAADYVFILDPWWNPAVEAQAIDRSHRIGQTRQVMAYRLIAKDTIEEKILALQSQKRDLADSILEGNTKTLRDLSREDIEALFA